MRNMMSVTQLAEVTGKDRRTVTERIAGLTAVVQGRSHLYNTRDALPLIYDVASRDQDQGQKLRDEQLRYQTESADKVALHNAKLRGELVAVEDVGAAVDKKFAAIRAGFLAIPSKYAGELSSLTSVIEIKEILDFAVNEVLTELTEAALKRIESNDSEETQEE